MDPTLEMTTQETLELLRKAATSGLLTTTGVQGVDLSGLVSLVPVNVPARNNTSAFPRTTSKDGALTATWRALLNVNSGQTDAAVGMDYAGSMTNLSEQDCFAPYRPLGKAGRVTLDAVAIAKNFADALAVSELQTLNQLFLSQDMHIVNSQCWSLGTPTAPTLSTATTGGSIAASATVHVMVAARSGANYFVGGSSAASADASLAVGSGTSTNTVTASISAIKGAVAYDWYVGTAAGASSHYYYTTTTVANVVITSVPGSAQGLPSLPLLSSLAPGLGVSPFGSSPTAGSGTAPTADTSYGSNYWYNGVIASSLGDYGPTGPVTPGSGTATGATFIDNGGNAPQLSGGGVDILDKLNDSLWASVQLSPTAYMINSLQGDEISKLILSSSSATTFLPPTDADARTNLAGGGYIGRYINRAAGGVPIPLEVHPHVAPGTIIARTDRVPFPGSNIGTVFEVRCLYDSMRFDYAANLNPGTLGGGPRYDYEIRSAESLINRAPVAQAIAANVA